MAIPFFILDDTDYVGEYLVHCPYSYECQKYIRLNLVTGIV